MISYEEANDADTSHSIDHAKYIEQSSPMQHDSVQCYSPAYTMMQSYSIQFSIQLCVSKFSMSCLQCVVLSVCVCVSVLLTVCLVGSSGRRADSE